jgi:predicted  nucleic acid-binding Zn-ribbon protein
MTNARQKHRSELITRFKILKEQRKELESEIDTSLQKIVQNRERLKELETKIGDTVYDLQVLFADDLFARIQRGHQQMTPKLQRVGKTHLG